MWDLSKISLSIYVFFAQPSNRDKLVKFICLPLEMGGGWRRRTSKMAVQIAFNGEAKLYKIRRLWGACSLSFSLEITKTLFFPEGATTSVSSGLELKYAHRLTANKNVENIPTEIIMKDINVPSAPKSTIVEKFQKNCFFFTWNLLVKQLLN